MAKVFMYFIGENHYSHELTDCAREMIIANSWEEVDWRHSLPEWKVRWDKKRYARVSVYQIDLETTQVQVLCDYRHPLKEKIILNKKAVELSASKRPSKLLNSIVGNQTTIHLGSLIPDHVPAPPISTWMSQTATLASPPTEENSW